ncbi:Uma2 family endonuclease [Butyrivibrio sp. INlla16]|uniref:Uma2 family endonuclease n=1 Tax=Butyrivibrio sp. INlla16 TaxID=1520807 RepID=UPI00088AD1F1|nr:Uma2 family endonuclease [Butyrivibrio sp. INlla16]SDB60217.1 Endonuclease, Uma2 family (restriction endonuclease fold) [Butyrivibrio sp. INlla16]
MNIKQMVIRKNELGLSYEQIAKLSGVPIGTVQKVLGGVTKTPRYDTLIALESVLGDHPENKSLEEDGAIYGSSVRKTFADFVSSEKEEAEKNAALAAKIKASKKPGEFTLEDYYALPDDQRVELIDGVFYDMGAPSTTHQIVAFSIGTQIKNYIDSNNGSCVPLMSPCDVQLDMDDKTMLQPDFMIVCNKDKIIKRKVYGAPDFIIEVLSSSTKKKDMTTKLTKYEKAGVNEYWMIDIDKQKILVYDFAHEFDVTIYGFNDKVPIALYEGKCKVDFAPILKEISFLLDS